MLFYSTNNTHRKTTLREAVLKGLADDRGLFMPEQIPRLDKTFFESIHALTPLQISLHAARAIFGGDVPEPKLKEIVTEALNFPIPLVKVTENIFSLELFHGPTLAFKDVGARFMARLLAHFREGEKRDITVLVATSGDTGSAVANGFLGVTGTRVVILYPSGKVSEIQEKQLTTLGQNITALEVKGTFDDCQRMVKQAFLDDELKKKMTLTSANSINVARLLPQAFYYFIAYAQLPVTGLPAVVSVPCGNFGNLTAGLIARRMGLPVQKFIAATNVNDVVPQYLQSGKFIPKPSRPTISNAMDVGSPSNFARMLNLYDSNLNAMRQDIFGCSLSDDATRKTMREVFKKHGYLLDPHGAVAFAALRAYLSKHRAAGIFLETAHPAKFPDIAEEATGEKVVIPRRLAACLAKKKNSVLIGNSFTGLKNFLLGAHPA